MADDPIKHIVVLMFENRSFDHILGGTPKMRSRYGISGFNEYNGKRYTQTPGVARQVPDDPVHETKDVLIRRCAKRDALNEHQSAIVAMSHNLESMTDEDANLVAARSRHVLTGPQSQIDAAVERVDNFISQQKAKVDSWSK